MADLKEEIYKDYYDKVHRLIYSKVLDNTLADDLSEDVFVKIYSKLDSFDSTKASISTWIFRITQNTLIDYYRTRKVYSEVSEDIEDDSEIEESVLNEEMLNALADALEKLDERDRNLVVLHYYSGLTLKEAALKLGMSYSNAKLVHNKSIVLLRQYLEEYQ